MKIFLDDTRMTPDGWIRTFTVEETIILIRSNPNEVEALSLDNDLGEDETEGYKICDWIEKMKFLGRTQWIPKKIFVHSSNPVARARMEQIIKRIY